MRIAAGARWSIRPPSRGLEFVIARHPRSAANMNLKMRYAPSAGLPVRNPQTVRSLSLGEYGLWLGRFAAIASCLFALAGCGRESLVYREVKRIDEKVTEAELEAFLEIVDALPEKRLPELPTVFAPAPDWHPSRTLPVDELMKEEQKKLRERWDIEWLARQVHHHRPLQQVLRQHQATPEQFVAMYVAIGVALSRSNLRPDQDLDQVLEAGEARLERLKREKRPFSSLSREMMHYVLQQAIWLNRVDRATQLRLVPPENLALVAAYRDTLNDVFPPEFTGNPLDAVADLLEELGMPFEELAENGSDAQIRWDPKEALVGYDDPDPEFDRTADGAPASSSATIGPEGRGGK
jgi:hypothetical protein